MRKARLFSDESSPDIEQFTPASGACKKEEAFSPVVLTNPLHIFVKEGEHLLQIDFANRERAGLDTVQIAAILVVIPHVHRQSAADGEIARVAELERLVRYREGITVERSADQLEDIQRASERALAVCQLDRDFNQLRNARAALRSIQEGGFGSASSAIKTSTRSGSRQCRGPSFAFGARKPQTAILKRWKRHLATSSAAPPEVRRWNTFAWRFPHDPS